MCRRRMFNCTGRSLNGLVISTTTPSKPTIIESARRAQGSGPSMTQRSASGWKERWESYGGLECDLIDVLRAIFNSDLFDEKYCTLDGLDEALADTQVDVLDAFSNLPVNFLIMSRPLPLLKELMPEATFIDILVHDADIEQLIEEKLRRMRTLRNLLEKEDWKEKVLKTVVEKSSGMFLLASLQLDLLGECMHIKALRSALDALPVGINTMYEATMERIHGRPGSDLAFRALTWLVYARESLRMDDLRHALAVDTTTFTYDSELLIDPETLLSVCCGLITFEPTTEFVRLVHYTARDFLGSYISKTKVDAQAMLTCTCVARLRGCGFENYDGDRSITAFYSFIKNHPFLEYAHRNWAAHAQSSESQPSSVEEFIQLCQHFPWTHADIHGFDSLNSIQLAAACNYHGLLARLLGLDPSPTSPCPLPPNLDVNYQSPAGYTALALAASRGHLATVELLLRVEGIDVGCPDYYGELSPLAWASGQGHVQVVDMLLGVVDADHVNIGPRTALMRASRAGHTEVMKSLLGIQGIDVNASVPQCFSDGGDSALTIATQHGHLDAVQLLLGVDGIDVNASHCTFGTAIAQASRRGSQDLVTLLLRREDIDINASRCKWGTALMQAASRGHKDIVELLLQREDTDVNAIAGGRSALSWAVARNNLEMAELLRSHGAR
ncbi:ankyrin [Coprinopsis marcescibilis]|nr:ankyrin [Coprinopsis marcescibilis]